MTNQQIITSMQKIIATYQSILAFFYQKIDQTLYTNNQLAVYPINYSLLLSSSQFLNNLTAAQVNTQIQFYIDLCDNLILGITTTIGFQSNLFYEQIQNTLNDSITQLNGFSESLINAAFDTIFSYTVQYNMSLSEALYINNIGLDDYAIQARLNYDLTDFNNLRQGQQISLSKTL